MASECPLLLGLNRDEWTLNLLRATIQELSRENYRIELGRPGETRPILMRRLDNLLDRLRPDTVNMLTERHRQRNWRQEDVVRNRPARRPRAAARVQPRIRLNLREREPPLPAETRVPNNLMQNPRAQSDLAVALQVVSTRLIGETIDELRRRILELEVANNGLATQVSEFAEAEANRGIEAEQLRGRILELEAANNGLTGRISELEAANNGSTTQISESAEVETRREVEANRLVGRNSQLEMANRGLTANLHELERAATAQAIEKLILEDRTEHLEATLAARNRQTLSSRVSMLEAAMISMQEENMRFDEGTVGISESAVRELVEINGEKNNRWASSRNILRGNESDHRKVQLLDEVVQGWDRSIIMRNNQRQTGRQ
ncbi:hypothetical protein BGAL_0184g00210 [Botrytis galanthina]|uniref:Uncharacterized protein n=1 Tax=Botrytis galanthina TaxID=278940 RepID=A0A4S8R623_9HELO|nr:hypothetical protein BGAL_0184g00210 [Botrytis galanthina]